MQTQNQIENFLFQGKFEEARECLNNGENFNEQYLKNNFSQITAKIIEAKEIDFIEKLIKARIIETDIYELDSFDKCIFAPLSLYLKDDGESISFFKELITVFVPRFFHFIAAWIKDRQAFQVNTICFGNCIDL